MSDTPTTREQPAPPRTPRWVKVIGAVAAVLIAGLLAMALMGGGEHGPGRHLRHDNPSQEVSTTHMPGHGPNQHSGMP